MYQPPPILHTYVTIINIVPAYVIFPHLCYIYNPYFKYSIITHIINTSSLDLKMLS